MLHARMFALVLAAGWIGSAAATAASITLREASSIRTGSFANGACEIAAYDKTTHKVFVVNGATEQIDVYSIADLHNPQQLASLALPVAGGSPNSVATGAKGLVAVAIEAPVKTDPGTVALYDNAGTLLASVQVGALPDMLTFTPNGSQILVANEGEPSDDYTADPEGTVSIITLPKNPAALSAADVRTVLFSAFNGASLDPSIRIYGTGATVAQDLEPEYIAVDPSSRTAYVTCQENNALAVIDIPTAACTALRGLGFKDHSLPGNTLDASDRDNGSNGPAYNPQNWPVLGMFQPDSIEAVRLGNAVYCVTANEGDARGWAALNEEARVGSLTLDPTAFPNASTLKQNANLGRLTVSNRTGDTDDDGDFDQLHVFGARSFSIWNAATGALVYDSGDDFETIIAEKAPWFHNANNDDNNTFDTRSDNKGPEPEALALGRIGSRVYAFIGMERSGGIMAYDITDPNQPAFVEYTTNRLYFGDPGDDTAGDLGPEGLEFVPAADSPSKMPLLLVANEVSGSVTVYEIFELGGGKK